MAPEIETLSRLVAANTISDQPLRELAAYVARRCEDLGFRIEYFDDPDDVGKTNVIATAGPERDGEGLVLSGHMDVVPVAGQDWSSDPFVLTERGGKLHGRGSADMKGFIACTLEALGRLDLAQLRQPLVLAWTHDEEIGCVGSRKLVAALKTQDRALPRECLIGEPTDFRMLRMHPGHVGMRIRTTGLSAHSSMPDLGASAFKAMTRVLSMLEQLEQELISEANPEFMGMLERNWVTMNPATLQGGAAINIVPDACALELGYRPLPGDDPLQLFRRIEARLAELELPTRTGACAELIRVTPSMLTAEGTPLQGLLSPHACSHQTAAASFATDGGNLAALGMDCLVFGPGSIDVAHKPDEYVGVADLLRGTDMVEAVVRARCL